MKKKGTHLGDTYLGLASLVIVAISIRLWIRAFKRVEIPKNRGGYVAAWIVAAGLGLAALVGEPGWLGGIPAGFGVFASTFFLLTIVIGGQKVGDEAIRVGPQFPISRPRMKTDGRSTRKASLGIRCSSNSFADIGDLTVSPSYGDGKNSGPSSTSAVSRSSRSARTPRKNSRRDTTNTDSAPPCCRIESLR